ncbi:ODA1 [Symbiodinium sp. CCMP2592]|nr:ODA1 [Symbiodinium sp. CCMP2592]
MHHEIEIMTRRLELEKRRLKRMDKELEAAQKTHAVKETQARQRQNAARAFARPKSGGADRARTPTRPKSSGGRQTVSDSQTLRSSQLLPSKAEPSLAERMIPMRQLVAQMDVQVKKLDAVKHDNAELQGEVQQIRKRKKQLALIFERLKYQIRGRSAQIRDFVEEAAQSKAVSSEAQQRVEVMRRQRDDERRSFTEKVLEIRKDIRMVELDKRQVEVRLKQAEGRVQRKNELILPPEEEEFSEPSMMRRIMKTAFLNCIQRRHIKQHQKSIEIFEQAFRTIKERTGISNIEEIVKIFVHLESRNFSLLTYVNHMNREIEALEGVKRGRRQAEMTLKQREVTSEKNRELALGDMQKKLRATQITIEESREVCDSQRQVVQHVLPQISQVARLLELESERLREAGHASEVSDFPTRPSDELRPDTMLLWLQWVEDVLSRFRDLLPLNDPAVKETYFPATAGPAVKNLQPKRTHHQPVPNVKPQDLPPAPLLGEDGGTQKRAGGLHKDKADAEEDSDQEDFDHRPLTLKEIRSRAQNSRATKGRIREPHRPSNVGFEDPTGTTSLSLSFNSSRQVSAQKEATAELKTGTATLLPELASSRRSVGFQLGLEPAAVPLDEDAAQEGGTGGRGNEASESDSESRDSTPLAKQPMNALNLRVRQLIQVAAMSRTEEVTQDELDVTFLRKYNMSRQELEVMADRMGMRLSHLCFMKSQFDIFDQDQSGYINAAELRSLFTKIGEEITEHQLEEAVRELDTDQSGEVEFFEFVEWFCS